MHKRHLIAAALVLRAAAALAQPNPLPDAPSVARSHAEASAPHSAPAFDRRLWIATGIHFAVRAIDDGHTCQNLASGGHEYGFPTQSCAGVIGFNTAWFAGVTFVSYEFAKHGHRKIALALTYAATTVDAGELLTPRASYHKPETIAPTAPLIAATGR